MSFPPSFPNITILSFFCTYDNSFPRMAFEISSADGIVPRLPFARLRTPRKSPLVWFPQNKKFFSSRHL